MSRHCSVGGHSVTWGARALRGQVEGCVAATNLKPKPVAECDPSSQRGPLLSRPIYPRYNDKQLTSAISKATTAEYLLQLACAYQGSLNPIHVAAFITKLATINKQYPEQAPSSKRALAVRPAVAGQQLLHKLQQKLREQECQGQTIRGLANIIWALAKLPCRPDPKLLHMLIRNFYSQLPSAVPQDISNVLWGVAELTGRACTTTQAGPTHPTSPSSRAAPPSTSSSTTRCSKERQIGATPPDETTAAPAHQSVDEGVAATQHDDRLSQYKHMLEHQESASQPTTSACDDVDMAAADICTCSSCRQQLPHQPAGKHLLSLVQVHHLLQQLCKLLDATEPQTIGNVSWALTVLQKCNKWCMCPCLPQVRAIMLAFADCAQEALPDTMQRVVHCMSGLAAACTNHAGQSWIDWQPPLLSTLMSALVTQQKLQQHIVLSVLKDVAQVGHLFLPYDTVQQLSTGNPSSAARVWRTADKYTTSTACGGAHGQDANDLQLEPLQQQQEHVEMLQAGSSQRADSDMTEAAGTCEQKLLTQHSDSIQADHAAAGCTAAGGDIEQLADDPLTAAALKQLDLKGVGLLKHYKALQRRSSGRIPIIKQLEGHQVAAAALPDHQLQYKPPTAEVLEQRTTSPQRCQLRQQQDGSKSGVMYSGSVSTKCGQPKGVGRHSWAAALHSHHMSETSEGPLHYIRPIAYAPVATELPWVAPPQPQPSPLVASSSGSWQGMYPHQQQPTSWQHSQRLYQQQQQQNPWQHGPRRPQNGQPYARGSHQLGHPQQEDELRWPERQQQQHSGDSNDYPQQQRYTKQQYQELVDLGDRNHPQQLYHATQVQLSEPVSPEAAVQGSPFAAAVTNISAAAPDGQDNFAKGQSTVEVLASTTESTFSTLAITNRPLGVHGSSLATGASDTFWSGSSSQQSVPAASGFVSAVGRSNTASGKATPPTQEPTGIQQAPAANLTLKTAASGSSSSIIALQLLARQVSHGLGAQLQLMETAAGSAVSASRAGIPNQQIADQHAEVLKAGPKQRAVSSNPAAATAACVDDDDTRLNGVASGSLVLPSFGGRSFLDEAATANAGTSSFELGLKLHAAALKTDSISNASSSVTAQQPTKPVESSLSDTTRSQQQLQMSQQAQQQQQVHQGPPHPQHQQSLPSRPAYTAQELAAAELVHVQHASGQVKSYRQMPDGSLIPIHVEKAKQLQHQHDSSHLTSTAGHAQIHNDTLQQLLQQKLFKHSLAPDAWRLPQQQVQVHSQLQIRALFDVVDTSAPGAAGPAASSTTAGVFHDSSASGLFPTAQGLLQQQQRHQQFTAKANMGGTHDPVMLLPPRGGQQRQLRQQHFSGAQTAVPPVPGVSQHQQLQHQHQFLLSRSGHIQVVSEADLRTEVTTRPAPNAVYPSLITNAAMPISCGTLMAAASPASVQNPQFTGGVLDCAGLQQHALQSSMSGQLGMSSLASPSTRLVQLPDPGPHVLGYDQAPLGINWDPTITNTALDAVPDHSLVLLGLGGDGMVLQVPSDYQQQQFVIQHQPPQGLTWSLGL